MKNLTNIKEISDRSLLELILANQLSILHTLSYHEFLIRHSDDLKGSPVDSEVEDIKPNLKKAVGLISLLNARLKEGVYGEGLKINEDGNLVFK